MCGVLNLLERQLADHALEACFVEGLVGPQVHALLRIRRLVTHRALGSTLATSIPTETYVIINIVF